MRKLTTTLITLFVILFFVSVTYAQNGNNTGGDNGADNNAGGDNTGGDNGADNNAGGDNTGGDNGANNNAVVNDLDENENPEKIGIYGLNLQVGIRGLGEFSVLTSIASSEGNQNLNCNIFVWDIGLIVYYGISKDLFVGFDFNYMDNGVMNFHLGYKQDFMTGPTTLAVNVTAGYDIYIDDDRDIGHGFGAQAMFVCGYEIFNWLEIGGDIGINFAMVFPQINGESVTVTFLTVPLRLYFGVKF